MATPAHSTSRTTTDRKAEAAIERMVAWIKAHQSLSLWILIIVVVGGGALYWNRITARQTETKAGTALSSARLAFESKNYQLASSELSQIIANYSGTRAAQEATLLLAQVHMLQGQSQQAVAELAKFAPDASHAYRAQAYGLLGAAYENSAHPKEAAQAYQEAADAADMDFLKAGYLSDAGRAHAEAGDTAQAIAAYATIATKYDSTATVTEALVRLGELTKGAWHKPAAN